MIYTVFKDVPEEENPPVNEDLPEELFDGTAETPLKKIKELSRGMSNCLNTLIFFLDIYQPSYESR